MTDRWYALATPDAPLTQGDLIFDCPVLTWQTGAYFSQEGTQEPEILKNAVDAISVDVIVMSQACDLEQSRVDNVILCPHESLDEHKTAWEDKMRGRRQNPTPKGWKAHCHDICQGFIFNYTMLNSGQVEDLSIGVRIVYFHEVFTVPRIFLESLLVHRGKPRFRLLPPYREHLSQAFARFFMRVGLPTPIETPWQP
jgi:hypothetical protein